MAQTLDFTVSDLTGRIDKVIAATYPEHSRSQVQQWLKEKQVTVNQTPVKANYKVVAGDQVHIEIPETMPLELIPEDIPLDIVYEDDDVIVVNKPQGMVVHPAPGHPDGTLVNALLYHSPLSTINGKFRPGIVHRIDKDTSGLLMVAKNDHAHASLAAQLKVHSTKREYIALVHGVIKEDRGTIDAPLGRAHNDRKKQAVIDGGRHAVTHFKVLERFEHYTLIRCRLETGRTHQIRVHLAYIHHPVAGDPLYGPKKTLTPNHGQFLHAALLGFKHPVTGKDLLFEAPLPPLFQETLDKLRRHG
ncbi:pseudouridine synthase, RluA family [Lactobacillus selangorensis]|uniref:Pseudouridine synthase n=1 Tax=Lactobacillus selangorensis TaxID=81857 RepID=A0A0R2FP89_9LACO|nr:RluA family pseudouridine synthase [Lactobacillus selangorensis]KRN29478.1 pseudouridine synthase, RluA family [Lactobacillus selangorensis]KRN33992.1 pseudouridine synthase, RluA family [Lactobacillus selangorensis]